MITSVIFSSNCFFFRPCSQWGLAVFPIYLRCVSAPILSPLLHCNWKQILPFMHLFWLTAQIAFLQVLPELFSTIRNCEDVLREFSFWQLGSLVSIVRQVWFFLLLIGHNFSCINYWLRLRLWDRLKCSLWSNTFLNYFLSLFVWFIIRRFLMGFCAYSIFANISMRSWSLYMIFGINCCSLFHRELVTQAYIPVLTQATLHRSVPLSLGSTSAFLQHARIINVCLFCGVFQALLF